MNTQNILRCAGFAAAVLLTASCARIEPIAEELQLGKPQVSVAEVAVTDFDLERAELLVDLAIDNANPVPLPLAGIAYDLKVAGRSLVAGTADQQTRLAARSVSRVPLSVTVKFDDLRRIYRSLSGLDEFEYQLDGSVGVDLPLLGVQQVPLASSGRLPVPRMPRVRLAGVDLGTVGLTGAEVVLRLAVENPNTFGLDIKSMNFGIDVNQQNWGSGTIDQAVSLPAKARTELAVPLNLDFARIGQSGFQLLVRSERFDYRLSGGLELDTTLRRVRNLKLPFDVTGSASSL